MKQVGPITIAEITPEWVALRREIIVRDGYAARAGESFSIELKSLTTNEWFVLTLTGGARSFTTAADRDVVLSQLQGGT